MNILALDTSGATASVAGGGWLFNRGNLSQTWENPFPKGYSNDRGIA